MGMSEAEERSQDASIQNLKRQQNKLCWLTAVIGTPAALIQFAEPWLLYRENWPHAQVQHFILAVLLITLVVLLPIFFKIVKTAEILGSKKKGT